ncbi:hypothetical protein HMPREF1548_01972 [Clostridium sp. KLE 1755]|nr:hypothetical protein HMPREF1548_01972 [Clostridium sp. KLE 1755]
MTHPHNSFFIAKNRKRRQLESCFCFVNGYKLRARSVTESGIHNDDG